MCPRLYCFLGQILQLGNLFVKLETLKRVLLETSKTPIFNLINVNVNLSHPSLPPTNWWQLGKHLQNWFLAESSPWVLGELKLKIRKMPAGSIGYIVKQFFFVKYYFWEVYIFYTVYFRQVAFEEKDILVLLSRDHLCKKTMIKSGHWSVGKLVKIILTLASKYWEEFASVNCIFWEDSFLYLNWLESVFWYLDCRV